MTVIVHVSEFPSLMEAGEKDLRVTEIEFYLNVEMSILKHQAKIANDLVKNGAPWDILNEALKDSVHSPIEEENTGRWRVRVQDGFSNWYEVIEDDFGPSTSNIISLV